MDDFPVNPIDILVAIVLLLSALLAFSRGAVREVLGIGAWIGAGAATFYGFQHVRPLARDLIESELVADAVAALVIFVLVLIALALLSQIVAARVQRGRLGAVDRAIGFFFGLLRGAVLLCLAYMLFVWAMAEDDRPPWVAKARTLPYIVRGTEAIRSIVPDELEEKAAAVVRRQSDTTSDALKALRQYEELQKGSSGQLTPPPEGQ